VVIALVAAVVVKVGGVAGRFRRSGLGWIK
jgi:hypothetical protein